MTLQGFALTSSLLRDAGAESRFWYWRGVSGRRYVHTVYAAGACPPLPGALLVAVKRVGTLRVVVGLGIVSGADELHRYTGCDEIHLHLLSRSRADGEAILADLKAGVAAMAAPGFAEAA
jgi:hypothetical protein